MATADDAEAMIAAVDRMADVLESALTDVNGEPGVNTLTEAVVAGFALLTAAITMQGDTGATYEGLVETAGRFRALIWKATGEQ
jgi:hypothetical protein